MEIMSHMKRVYHRYAVIIYVLFKKRNWHKETFGWIKERSCMTRSILGRKAMESNADSFFEHVCLSVCLSSVCLPIIALPVPYVHLLHYLFENQELDQFVSDITSSSVISRINKYFFWFPSCPFHEINEINGIRIYHR